MLGIGGLRLERNDRIFLTVAFPLKCVVQRDGDVSGMALFEWGVLD